jgi:polyisoprenoid-binding protein YceI
MNSLVKTTVTLVFLTILGSTAEVCRAQAPVFVITPETSSVKFFVKPSVAIESDFDIRDATLTFASPDESTRVLDVKNQAATVSTGSGFTDDKFRSKDFFDLKKDPLITFKSTKIVQTGPNTFDVQDNFTIRGVTKPDTLILTVDRDGKASGEIKGTPAFDRKDYRMDSRIPFIKIADRVEVTVALQAKRVSGPPVTFKQ